MKKPTQNDFKELLGRNYVVAESESNEDSKNQMHQVMEEKSNVTKNTGFHIPPDFGSKIRKVEMSKNHKDDDYVLGKNTIDLFPISEVQMQNINLPDTFHDP